MIIGVPKEIKEVEKRVGMTPQGVDALVAHGHRVLVERGAGEGSGFSDQEYRKAGAMLVEKAKDVWNEAEIVVKVKEPLEPEFPLMSTRFGGAASLRNVPVIDISVPCFLLERQRLGSPSNLNQSIMNALN